MTKEKTASFDTPRLKWLSWFGLVCLMIPAIILFMWIHAFNLGTDQASRVKIFLGYFPGFMSVGSITVLEIAFCLAGIFVASKSLRMPGWSWKILNLTVITGTSLLLLLQIWGLM